MSEKVNGKARSEAIQSAARILLEEQEVDVNEQVQILPLAKLLEERAKCSRNIAKLHIAKAIRCARGDITRAREWGGARPGAGRPKEEGAEP